MPFGDDEVQINYRATVTGMQDVEALGSANADLQGQTQAYTSKVNEASVAMDKHKNVLLQTHAAVRQLHRELYSGVIVFALVTGGLKAMAAGSESAQIGLEQLTSGATKVLGSVGDLAAKVTAFAGALWGGADAATAWAIANKQINDSKSFDTQSKELDMKSKLLAMESNLYKTTGDELMSLKKKQEAEDTALAAERILLEKNTGDKMYQINVDNLAKKKDLLKQEHDAETEAFRLHSMGLKQQSEIESEFKRGIGGDFTSGGADVLNKILTGQKQTASDAIKSFTDGFAKTISTAISESFFSSLASGKGFGDFFHNFMNILTGKKDDPVSKAIDKTNAILVDNDKMLAAIRDCVCRTAAATEAMASCGCSDNSRITSATITPGKVSTASKLAGVFGAIAGAASGLAGLPGLGGGGIPGIGGASTTSSDFVPTLTIAPQGPIAHSGMEVPMFPSGGEVPIMAQPGEFVVRRTAAQDNKELLKSVNSGARQSKQTQNVYFINANDAKSFADMLSSPSARAQMETQIIRAIMGNGQLRDTIKNFGRG